MRKRGGGIVIYFTHSSIYFSFSSPPPPPNSPQKICTPRSFCVYAAYDSMVEGTHGISLESFCSISFDGCWGDGCPGTALILHDAMV